MAKNGYIRLPRVKDGRFSVKASIGAEKAVDGKPHNAITDPDKLKAEVKVLDRPNGWDDGDYDSYLYGVHLKTRVVLKDSSGLLKVQTLTQEEKDANKVTREAKRDEKGFDAQRARMTPVQIREALLSALSPEDRAAVEAVMLDEDNEDEVDDD